jgi:putative ABC transport system permease protein
MRLLPWEYAVRNLGRSPTRLWLGVAGATVSVLLVLAAAAFVRGMGASLGGTGGARNVMVIGAGSEESAERSEISAASAGILAASVPGIRERLGVAYVSPEIHMAVLLAESRDATTPLFANFRGVTSAAYLVHQQVRITEGRAPGPSELLVGNLAAARIGLPEERLAVGRSLWLDDREWTISGRFEAPGSVMDAEIWCDLQELRIATQRDTYSCVVLTMDAGDVTDVELFCKQRLDLELVAMTEAAYYARLFHFYGPVRAMVWVTALLVASGAFLGGLNTLYAAFATRIRELAAVQTLGYSRAAVVTSLVQESLITWSAGSVIAAALALLALDGLAVRISMGAFGLAVDGPAMAGGLAVGLVLGVIGALPPAWRSLRLPIAEALRAG